MSVYKLFMVGAGGFIGSILRYLVVNTVDTRMSSVFPYGTLLVNFAGSFLLGFLVGYFQKTDISDPWRLFLTTGICGGFTTFSAFALENVNLFQQRMIMTSATYIAVSLALGVAAIIAGSAIGRLVH